MKKLFYSILMTAMMTGLVSAQDINPKQLARYVVTGDYASALAESDRLIEHYRKLVAADPKLKDGWTNVDILQVGYYLNAKSQVLALKGDFGQADAVLKDATDYAASHEQFRSGANSWAEVPENTRGLILEKKGNRDAARKAYQKNDAEDGRARLALMLLEDGANVDARTLALKDPTNPTANLVLGRLEEKAGNRVAARGKYAKAWAQIQESLILGKNNYFLPVYFCEGPEISKRLERVKNVGVN